MSFRFAREREGGKPQERRKRERVSEWERAMPLSFFFFIKVISLLSTRTIPSSMEAPPSAAPPSSAVSAANEALQRNDAAYFSSLSQADVEKICSSADEDGR